MIWKHVGLKIVLNELELILMFLDTVKWFQVFLSNTNNSI